MTQIKAKLVGKTLCLPRLFTSPPPPLGAELELADGKRAFIAVQALQGDSDEERLARLQGLPQGAELELELCSWPASGPAGAAEVGSIYQRHMSQARAWMSRGTVLSGPVIRGHRAFYFSMDLPEGLSGRLQFCDVRGGSDAERRERTYEIARRLGEKVRVQVRSVCPWPTSLEIYVKEIDFPAI